MECRIASKDVRQLAGIEAGNIGLVMRQISGNSTNSNIPHGCLKTCLPRTGYATAEKGDSTLLALEIGGVSLSSTFFPIEGNRQQYLATVLIIVARHERHGHDYIREILLYTAGAWPPQCTIRSPARVSYPNTGNSKTTPIPIDHFTHELSTNLSLFSSSSPEPKMICRPYLRFSRKIKYLYILKS